MSATPYSNNAGGSEEFLDPANQYRLYKILATLSHPWDEPSPNSQWFVESFFNAIGNSDNLPSRYDDVLSEMLRFHPNIVRATVFRNALAPSWEDTGLCWTLESGWNTQDIPDHRIRETIARQRAEYDARCLRQRITMWLAWHCTMAPEDNSTPHVTAHRAYESFIQNTPGAVEGVSGCTIQNFLECLGSVGSPFGRSLPFVLKSDL